MLFAILDTLYSAMPKTLILSNFVKTMFACIFGLADKNAMLKLLLYRLEVNDEHYSHCVR